MRFWKAKGELNLGPEKRRLFIWAVASPFVLTLAAIALSAIPPVAVLGMLFGFLSFIGNLIVIPWGLYNLSRINEEPYDFISSFRTLLILNSLSLLCCVSFASMIAMELGND